MSIGGGTCAAALRHGCYLMIIGENRDMANEERIVDFLICRNCSSPCYVYEIDGQTVIEALCQTCGNEDVKEFSLEDEDDAMG